MADVSANIPSWWDYAKQFPPDLPDTAYDAQRMTFFDRYLRPWALMQGHSAEDTRQIFMKETERPGKAAAPRAELVAKTAASALFQAPLGIWRGLGVEKAGEAQQALSQMQQEARQEAEKQDVTTWPYEMAGQMVGELPYFIPALRGAGVAAKILAARTGGKAAVEAAAAAAAKGLGTAAERAAGEAALAAKESVLQRVLNTAAGGAVGALYEAAKADDGHRIMEGLKGGLEATLGFAAFEGAFLLKDVLKARHPRLSEPQVEAIVQTARGLADEGQQALAGALVSQQPEVSLTLAEYLTDQIKAAKRSGIPKQPIMLEPAGKVKITMGLGEKTYRIGGPQGVESTDIEKVVRRVSGYLEKGAEIKSVQGSPPAVNALLHQLEWLNRSRGEYNLPLLLPGPTRQAGPPLLPPPEAGLPSDILTALTSPPEQMAMPPALKAAEMPGMPQPKPRRSVLLPDELGASNPPPVKLEPTPAKAPELQPSAPPPVQAPAAQQIAEVAAAEPKPVKVEAPPISEPAAPEVPSESIEAQLARLQEASRRKRATEVQPSLEATPFEGATPATRQRRPHITEDDMPVYDLLSNTTDGRIVNRKTGDVYPDLETALVVEEEIRALKARGGKPPGRPFARAPKAKKYLEKPEGPAETVRKGMGLIARDLQLQRVLQKFVSERYADEIADLLRKQPDKGPSIVMRSIIRTVVESGSDELGMPLEQTPALMEKLSSEVMGRVRAAVLAGKELGLGDMAPRGGRPPSGQPWPPLKEERGPLKQRPQAWRYYDPQMKMPSSFTGMTIPPGHPAERSLGVQPGTGKATQVLRQADPWTLHHEGLHSNFFGLSLNSTVENIIRSEPLSNKLKNVFKPSLLRDHYNSIWGEELYAYAASSLRTGNDVFFHDLVRYDKDIETVMWWLYDVNDSIMQALRTKPDSVHKRILERRLQDVHRRSTGMLDDLREAADQFGEYVDVKADGSWVVFTRDGRARTFASRKELDSYAAENWREPLTMPELVDFSDLPQLDVVRGGKGPSRRGFLGSLVGAFPASSVQTKLAAKKIGDLSKVVESNPEAMPALRSLWRAFQDLLEPAGGYGDPVPAPTGDLIDVGKGYLVLQSKEGKVIRSLKQVEEAPGAEVYPELQSALESYYRGMPTEHLKLLKGELESANSYQLAEIVGMPETWSVVSEISPKVFKLLKLIEQLSDEEASMLNYADVPLGKVKNLADLRRLIATEQSNMVSRVAEIEERNARKAIETRRKTLEVEYGRSEAAPRPTGRELARTHQLGPEGPAQFLRMRWGKPPLAHKAPITTEPPPAKPLQAGAGVFSYFFRRFDSWLSTQASKHGMPELYDIFKGMDIQQAQRSVFEAPYEKVLLETIGKFPMKRQDDLYKFLEAPASAKAKITQELHLKPEELNALQRLRKDFFDPLFSEFQIPLEKYIQDYAPRIRQRVLNGEEIDAIFPRKRTTNGELDFFAEHMRTGELDPRDTNLLRIAAFYLRSGARKKFLGEGFERAAKLLDETLPDGSYKLGQLRPLLQRHIEHLRGRPDFTQKMIDGTLQGGINTINSLVDNLNSKLPRNLQIDKIEKTPSDILGKYLLFTYAGTMGLRAMVPIRDSFQILLSYPMLGGKYLNEGLRVFGSAAKGGRGASAWDIPNKYGALLHRSELQNLFTLGKEQLEPSKAAKYAEALLKPLTWSNNASRLVTFWGHDGKIMDAARAYLPSGNINKFYQESGLFWLDEQLAQSFKSQFASAPVNSWQDLSYKASAELVNLSQWNYRRGAHPGIYNYALGRLFGQYGTWPLNYVEYARMLLTRGPRSERIKAGSRLMAAHYGLLMAGDAAGIDTAQWVFTQPGAYGGGPIFQAMINAPTAAFDWETYRGGEARGRTVRPFTTLLMPGGLEMETVFKSVVNNDPDLWLRLLGFSPLRESEPFSVWHQLVPP